ncbi:MAG: hypothetical protein OEY00_13010 [Gammaproteobacteria bacterium]|nr:hypothetical protein [Gammaproteobacteria bacterium]
MTQIEEQIYSAKKYGVELSLVSLGSISVLASLYCSYVSNDYSWLSRSGSLMVLFSVIVEYNILKKQQILNEAARSDATYIITKFSPVVLGRNLRSIQIAAHYSVIVGTLIWGYGDLFGRQCLN